MTIHLRTVMDQRGDAIEYCWYCSQGCYSQSLEAEPASDTFERGGAYPCGEESDSPDYCEMCSDPVGNPLTADGEAYVREYVFDVLGTGSTPWHYDNKESRMRAEALRAEYSYLFRTEEA